SAAEAQVYRQGSLMSLGRRLAAEGIGAALRLAAIIGSGIMGEQLAGGNTAVALLANTVATGAALVALILTFGTISGADDNSLASLCAAFWGRLAWREVPLYAVVQVVGAYAGVAAAHLMFGHELFSASRHVRAGL